MNLNDFMTSTLNKWVKLENNESTIIQNISEYKPTNVKNMYDCKGKSYSNVDNELIELDNFFMCNFHMNYTITEIPDNEVDEHIDNLTSNL